jgi:FkbH-like protein
MQGSEHHQYRVGIISSITAEPLTRHLKKLSYAVHMAPFHQLHQSCYNYPSVFPETLDTIIVIWRLEDYISEGEPDNRFLDDFLGAIRHLRQNFKGGIIVNRVYPPTLFQHDPTSIRQDFSSKSDLSKQANDALAKIDGLLLLDFPALLHKIGVDKAYDARTWYLYRQPWTQDFWALITAQINRLQMAQTKSPKKCLVLDADNTLWGGIVGEDGISGIQLGEDFPGNAYRDFQKAVLKLSQQGILLAMASKNNREDVLEVLSKHDAMILQEHHFVALEIHWKSKIESLQSIAKKLNIGLDSLVFVDDSPKEIAEIQAGLPMVTTLMVPEDVSNLPSLFQGLDLFDALSITEEDLKRTEFIQAEESRKQAEAALTAEAFLATLSLDIQVFKAQDEHLARITQLINKTNQFNLTTIRRSADEVKQLQQSADTIVIGLTVSDRFGDYGLVGVAIVEKLDSSTAYLDSFMMSCRVLGRGVESEFIKQVIQLSGCKAFKAEFKPTAKNQLAENFLKENGFAFSESERIWIYQS